MRDELELELLRWRAAGLERRLEPARGDVAREFTSNDTLGFSRRPELIEAAREALRTSGVGGRASRLLGGGGELSSTLESRAAEWLGDESALAFVSGYQANVGLLTTLARRGDVIFSDELNHASLIDAARASGATLRVFRHLDREHLAHLLAREPAARRRLVVTEGVFSMDGDSPDFRELNRVCSEHDAWLVVDEAHAAGLIGPRARGAFARDMGTDRGRLVARLIACGKALGVTGGIVCGDEPLIRLLQHGARSFVFTTAPSPAVTAALIAAIDLLPHADEERRRVLGFAEGFANALYLPRPAAAIVPVVIGDSEAATRSAAKLQEAGFDVRAVRPPTVPEGSARLRLTFHAGNSEEAVKELAQRLARHRSPTTPQAATARALPLVVVGTDTEIGKTVVSALLARAAARVGAAAYWKPVQSGLEDGLGDREEVARLTADATGDGVELLEPSFVFEYPASPHESAARAGSTIDVEKIDADLERFTQARGGTLVVEPAGGLLVPLTMAFTQADWLARHGLETVLVARSGLGTLNHTQLTLEALRARRLFPRALFLVGDEHPSNRETLAQRTGLTIFELPRLEPLTPTHLDAWIDAHGQALEDLFR